MANRVLIGQRSDGSYGFDLSLPGQEVYGATIDNLAFSTLAAAAGVIHVSGTVSRGGTVNFTPLAYVPMVLMQCVDGSGNSQGYCYTQSPNLLDSSNSVYNANFVEPYFHVTSSSITCVNLDTYTSPYPYTTFQYVVFRIPGAV